jgi:predicted metalloprotease with PDZ domain
MSQKEYLGGKLPVDKYAFIFYFTDKPSPGYGALEHSYSSFYFLPELTINELTQNLRSVAAHEFFHIMTPLTIHSHEIDKFDFNEPKMSKHLWLYEGMTEYFASHTQVRSGLMSQEQYLDVIRDKMNNSQAYFNDTLAFTKLSKETLTKYSDQYQNVYEKGALIGMCLDIILRKNSGGKYGTRELVLDLSKKYGKNSPFDDNELFATITSMTYPEVGEFFKRYVEGSERLPYKYVFDLVGISYIPEEHYRDITHGLEANALDYIKVPEQQDKMYLVITNASALNEQGKSLGLQDGDLIVSLNGKPIPSSGILTFLKNQMSGLEAGKTMTYVVLRKDETGTYREKELSGVVMELDRTRRNLLSFDANANEEQLSLRRAWLEK